MAHPEAARPAKPPSVERGPALSAHWARSLTLWLGVLLPPSAWALQLQSVFAMAPLACQSQSKWPMHLTTAGLLLVALVGGGLALRDWRAIGGGWPSGSSPDAGRHRARFLAVAGMGLSALFSLVITGQWVYVLAINPCAE